MLLSEIEEITSSDEKFKQYVEGEGEGEAGKILDLIVNVIEIDGASLSDYELLATISDITQLYKNYEARRGE
jgi:hypothetical protein